MTRGCGKPRPPDCPSERAKGTFLGLDMLSDSTHCLPLRLSPWKQNKMFLINSRALTWFPLYGAPIRLPGIAVSWLSHVTSSIELQTERSHLASCHGEQEGPWLPACQIMFCLLIMRLSLIQVFLAHWAGRSSTGSSLLLNYFSICWLYLSVLSLESLSFCLVFLSSLLFFSIILKNVVTFFTWLLIHQSLHAGCCLLTALTHPCPFKTNTNFLWNSWIYHGRKAFCEEFWTYLLPVLFSTQLE